MRSSDRATNYHFDAIKFEVCVAGRPSIRIDTSHIVIDTSPISITTVATHRRHKSLWPHTFGLNKLATHASPLHPAIEIYRAKSLARAAPLFEEGDPNDAVDDRTFIKRVNRHLSMRMEPVAGKVPSSLDQTISRTGRLNKHVELNVFGKWLIIDGMPGRKTRSGKPFNPRALLKVVACALAAQQAHAFKTKGVETRGAGNSFRVTSKQLVDQRWRLFGERSVTRNHTAGLRSLAYILPEYLANLKAGHLKWNGTVVSSSERLQELSRSLQKADKAPRKASGLARSPVNLHSTPPMPPAPLPSAFEIELLYSSRDQELQYRNVKAPHPQIPCLNYNITPTLSSSRTGNIRKDREDRLVLAPNFDISKEVRVRALIDRMVIILKTTNAVDAKVLQRKVKVATEATLFVHDRKNLAGKNEWAARLPELPTAALTGHHFALLVQDVDLKVLNDIIQTITDCAGIDGPVRPSLLEVAVDFYPKGAPTQDDMLVGRERIVALLQRHHWASHELLLDDTVSKPKKSDPRQVYQGSDGKTVSRHLFAKAPGEDYSDSQVDQPEVRNRILKAGIGNDLYLNAHIYRGTRTGKVQTNVQHKVEDRRDAAKRTSLKLTPEQCRGRVEFTLTGFDTLEAAGITDVSDLSKVSFRKMAKHLIRFRLPTSAATTEDVSRTISQTTHRGVYGVELRQRAAYLAGRACVNPTPRNIDREGMGLIDWPEMNKVVGDALYRLTTQWKKP